MSETPRSALLTSTAGVAVLVAFGALGFLAADVTSGDDGPEGIAVPRFPWIPADQATDDVLQWAAEEQDRTAQARFVQMNPDNADATEQAADIALGDPDAGGQAVRFVDEVEVDPETLEPVADYDPGDDGDALPADLFADMPFVAGLVDLTDVEVADPVGPLEIDICAGPERLPTTPAGCPPGFGGTIVPFSHDVPADDPADQGGRPPTGYTASGTDSLFVRTFRRSSVAEHVRVRAVEWSDGWLAPEAGCDPGDDIPESDAILPRTTIPIEGTDDPGAWPWDPEFDTLEVFGLSLEAGTDYAVCTYWVDTSGVGLAVTYWEANRIVTASARTVTVTLISFDTVNLDPDQHVIGEIDRLQVVAECRGPRSATLDWPGVGTTVRLADESIQLCDITSLSGLLRAGGIQVMTLLSYADRDDLPRSYGWIDIDRTDIYCRVDCTDSFVVGMALPVVEHEEYEPRDFRSAIPPSTWRAGRVGFLIDFSAPDETRHDWFIGEPSAFDTSERVVDPPPVVTSFAMVERRNELAYRVGDHGFATSRLFVLRNDTPVTVRVEVLDWGNPTPDGGPCVPPGTPVPAYESLTPATQHDIQLDGLCLGKDYMLQVTAVDEAGVRYDLTDRRRTLDRADKFAFDTRYRSGPTLSTPMYLFDLRAELVLGPQGGDACFRLGDLEYRESWAGGSATPVDNSRESMAARIEWDTARWGQDSTLPRYVHQETTSTSPSPALRLVIRDAEARELDNRISISVDYLPRTSLLCRRHAYGDAVDMGLSANPTLTELLAGVTITNGSDSYPYVRLQAEPVRTVIR